MGMGARRISAARGAAVVKPPTLVAVRRKVLRGRTLVATDVVETLTAMESAQLGMALIDASREAGAQKAKAKAGR